MSSTRVMSLSAASESARSLGIEHGESLEALDEVAAARRALALLAESNLLAWTVPADFGGAATDLCAGNTVSVRALSELRRTLAYQAGMLDLMFVMQGLGSFPVALAGSDDLRRELLPLVVGGQRISAFGLTEPNAGSSLGEVATCAERTAAGWRLDGHKTFISNVGIADFYTVLARTSGEPGDRRDDGLTMFFVAADAAGLSAEPFEVLAPHPIGDLRLTAVEVADGARLGAVGSGLAVALATLARFRTSVAAAACGFARRALDESLGYLARRKQFGKPLSANQGLRFELAEMDVRVRAGELLVDEAAELVDAEGDSTAAVARAKYWSTETASWVCDRAVQHHGGLGVKRGTLVERLFREVRALRIYEGTSEIQKLILAKELLRGV